MSRIQFNDGWTVGPNVSVFSEITGGATDVIAVELPHDAMLGLPRSPQAPSGPSAGYFESGAVVYRKKFMAPDEWRSRIIELEFHGVYRDAAVFLNGVLVAQRPNGYAPFRARLDDALRYGEENRLRVEARAHSDSRWYSGLGIYRDVELLEMPFIHLEPNGTRITTPDVDEDRGVVHVATDLTNDGLRPVTVSVRTRILDRQGAEVAIHTSPVTVRPRLTATAIHRLYVQTPERWSPESPSLYHLETQVEDHGEVVDSTKHQFGIRQLQLDPIRGLRINGEPTKLRGACIHHDNGLLGGISVPEAEFRRVSILKSAGFNAIRSAHNPISPALLDACDRLGMLVMDEAFDMWTEGKQSFDYSLAFSEWWERDLEAMVRRDFNHPSVIIYSIGNEILDAGKPLGAAIGRQLAEKVRSLDSSRFLTNGVSGFVATLSDTTPIIQKELGGVPGGINDVEGIGKSVVDRIGRSRLVTDAIAESHSVVDIVGHNYAAWRYEEERAEYPARVVVGTESNPKDIDENWGLVRRLSHVIGDFTWTGWDYIGEAGLGRTTYSSSNEIWDGNAYPALLAYCGDIDITGFRRPASYYREIVFGLRSEPFIAVHRPTAPGLVGSSLDWAWSDSQSSWTWDCPPGTGLTVDVYSDAEEVELVLNGRSLGRAAAGAPQRFRATFVVPYEPGVLQAIAVRGGASSESYIVESAGRAVAIQAVIDDRGRPPGAKYSYIGLELVDEFGRTVTTQESRIAVATSGGATLAGLGTARPATEESFLSSRCTTFEGRAQAIVRKTGVGPGIVTVSADGFPAVRLDLDTPVLTPPTTSDPLTSLHRPYPERTP